jgi:hypothetical protein
LQINKTSTRIPALRRIHDFTLIMKFPTSFLIRMALATTCFALQIASHATTLVVTNTADSGPGTLRDALAQTQTSDTITFDVTGIITNSSAQLVISNDINIIGPGPDVLAVMGNSNNPPRLFTVLNGVTANVSGLTLRDSYAGQFGKGGGISNAGTLSLTNCVFNRCKSGIGILIAGPAPGGIAGGAGNHGGAIYNAGTLTVIDCDFFTNSAAVGTDGGGGPAGTGGTGGYGGAIFTTGPLLAMNCNFLTNSAGKGGTGGSGFLVASSGSITGSTGGDGGYGGAIYATAPATFINCTFGWNGSGGGGAGGSGLSGTSGHPPGGNGGRGGIGGNAGAIFSQDQLTLTSCTFYQNHAGYGNSGGAGGSGFQAPGGIGAPGGNGGNGTIYCAGSAQITACTFYQNGAGNAGSAATGGAGGTGNPGGVGAYGGNGGGGGSVYAAASTPSVTLQSVLFLQNNVGGAGGGGAGGANGFGSGVAPSGTNGLPGAGQDLFGAFASLGHNYVRTNTGSSGLTNGIKSDLVNTNFSIAMAPLLPKGGRTLTCVMMSYTNAIVDGGDDAILGPPLNIATDQRGYPRLSGAHVDIGASEILSPTLPLVANCSVINGQFYITVTNVPSLSPSPALLIKSSLTGPWPPGGGPMTEITPGVYQTHGTASFAQEFFRVHLP